MVALRGKHLGVALALTLAVSPARAEPEIPNILPPPDHGARTLRGHTLIEPAAQETGFVTSHVGLRQGLSYLSVKNFPIYANERATVRMLGINDQLDVSIRVLPWLALNVAGDAFAASGLDGTSFFYGQAIYLINARAGALVRVYRSRATGTQLGVRGYAGFGTGQQLALPGFVQGVAARAAREVPDLLAVPADQLEDAAYTAVSNAADDLRNSAITTRNLARYGGALHLAQVIVPLLGFQSTFGLEGASARDRHFDPRLQYYVNTDSADTTLRFAAALSFDAYHLGVPLALLAEYAAEKTYRSVEGESSYVPSVHYFGAGLYYSGRSDLQLGVAAFTQRNLRPATVTALDGTQGQTDKPVWLHGQFVLRYVWSG